MNGGRISDVIDENIGTVVVDEDVGRHGLLGLRRRKQHGGHRLIPRPFQLWRNDLIVGREVARLDFHFITIVDDEGVGDDVSPASLHVVRHIFEEAPIDVVVDVEIIMGLFDPVPQIMGDVEADRINFLCLVEELDRIIVLHDALFRDAGELLLAVDQGRHLVGNRLAVGAKFLVPRLRVAVEASSSAGAGDGRR